MPPSSGKPGCSRSVERLDYWSIEPLLARPHNPRLHNGADLVKTAAIFDWGGTLPMLADEQQAVGQSLDEPADRQDHIKSAAAFIARKEFLVTDEVREQARSRAARGAPQEDIAKLIGCDAKTLRQHFRNELDLGMPEANAAIWGYLFAVAAKGNVTAQIVWLMAEITAMRWSSPRPCTAILSLFYNLLMSFRQLPRPLSGIGGGLE